MYLDNGDKLGNSLISCNRQKEVVWITKTGKLFYPKRNKSATIPITIFEARKKGYKPSRGYINFKKLSKYYG